MTDIHVILTDQGDPYGWSLHVPQAPGLTASRDTADELLAIIPELLELAGLDITGPDDPRIHIHEEHAVVSPSGVEYLVRWETGDMADERLDTASRLEGSVHLGLAEENLDRQPVLATGERLLIAALPEDRLRGFTEQLGPGGRATVSKSGTAEDGQAVVWSLPLGDGPLGLPGSKDFERFGLTPDSTFGEAIAAVLSDEVATLASQQPAPPPDAAFHAGLASA